MTRAEALDDGFILFARDYRDSSLILDVFSREQGRYSVVARGARSERSKVRGRLQPFSPLTIGSMGRSELKTATTLEFSRPAYRLVGEHLLLGLYINEVLYRLLGRFDPLQALYADYESLLAELQLKEDGVIAVRRFELALLQELGYGISFNYDAGTGGSIEADLSYRYVVHEGFYGTAAGEQSIKGMDLMNVANGQIELADSQKLKDITRRSLAELLGEKPLKSRSLFAKVRR